METSTDTSSADLESCKLITLPLTYKSLYNFVWTLWNNIIAFFGENGNVLILLTPIPSRLLFFWYSLGHKGSYDSVYDPDSDWP